MKWMSTNDMADFGIARNGETWVPTDLINIAGLAFDDAAGGGTGRGRRRLRFDMRN